MNDLRSRMREWLKDYIKPEELDDVSGILYLEARKHINTSSAIWCFIGILMGMALLAWIS